MAWEVTDTGTPITLTTPVPVLSSTATQQNGSDQVETPRKFVKRPVVIEAVEFRGNYDTDLAAWCAGFLDAIGGGFWTLTIPTLEGDMTARAGDYVIRGVEGEHYPCKASVFTATYREADQ